MPFVKHYPRILRHYTARKRAATTIQRAFRSKRYSTSKIKTVVRNMEPYKYQQQSLVNTIGLSWSFIANLNMLPYSITSSSAAREGTKVFLKHLSMRYTVEVASGDTTNVIRIAIVRGRRSGLLNAGDISYHPGGETDDYNLPFNQKYVDVLWSKTIKVQEQAAGAVFPTFHYSELEKNLNKTCKYTEAGVAEQPYNGTALYLIACSDSTLAPNPRISGRVRVSFKDLA